MKTNLKQIRKNAGWSNADDFAAHIGMPAKTYRNYEQGIRKIGLDVASDLCNALGCTLEELVDEKYDYAVIEIPQKETQNYNENIILSDERELLTLYRRMEPSQQFALLEVARSMAVASEKDGAGIAEHEKVAR